MNYEWPVLTIWETLQVMLGWKVKLCQPIGLVDNAPPPSTPHIQPVEGAGSTQEGNKNVVLDRPLQQTDMDVQRFSLKLGVTGFPSLADTKRLCLQSTGAA